MRHFIILLTLFPFSTYSFGQRIVGKVVYRYSKPYSVDTITKGKTSEFTVSADTILDLFDTRILNIKKVDKREVDLADSLIKNKLLDAIVYMDSIGFVTNTYDTLGHRMTPKDFLAYKSKNSDRFKKQYKAEKKRQQTSDKYYSAYTSKGDTWIIVMFDPLKDKRRMMGDVILV
jgi:hypothetical protein